MSNAMISGCECDFVPEYVTLERPEHPINDDWPIVCIEVGILSVPEREVQYENEDSPILWMFWKLILWSDWHE